MVGIRNYSSIYHLHIPRTAGVFLRNHLLQEFQGKESFATHYDPIDKNSLLYFLLWPSVLKLTKHKASKRV